MHLVDSHIRQLLNSEDGARHRVAGRCLHLLGLASEELKQVNTIQSFKREFMYRMKVGRTMEKQAFVNKCLYWAAKVIGYCMKNIQKTILYLHTGPGDSCGPGLATHWQA
jgi:hypothetical protein